ncbi:MAG: gliding motility protein GldM [Chitinophagaceae bacterium]|nr:gliding motility protein GldM [Chitinophagaceae bacterium]
MSLPKEPRQKMINMMYLVLTALLALNVSVEVLNAFKTVNHSIEGSNAVVTDKNKQTYEQFKAAEADPKTAEKAKPWAPKAYAAQKLSADLCGYIEGLKNQLIEESNPQMKDGKKEFTEGNLDAATRIMDTKGEGAKLYQSLADYKTNLLKLLDPSNYPDQPDNIKEDLRKDKALFEKELPLDLSVPKSESGNAATGNIPKDWTINYFHMTPTIAGLTILSKFQSDVKNSESQIIDYLHKKIGEVKVVYDQFKPLLGTNATYLMPGDELEVTAGIGAYSKDARPEITINGAPQTLNGDGIADYKTKVSATGTVNVKIKYTKPDGSTETIDKAVKYTVGQPSGASVFLEKMNVLYIKEDNPVKISGGSVGREKVSVRFTNGEITHTEGDSWNVVPTTPGEGKIIVTAEGKVTEFPMRVRYLPDPTGFVGAKKGGAISSAEFKAIGGLLAKLEGSEFQSAFRVVSYKLAAIGGNIPQYQEAVNEGPRWGGQAAGIVQRASPGTNIFFDAIRVVGKDGRTRELPPMVFNLK